MYFNFFNQKALRIFVWFTFRSSYFIHLQFASKSSAVRFIFSRTLYDQVKSSLKVSHNLHTYYGAVLPQSFTLWGVLPYFHISDDNHRWISVSVLFMYFFWRHMKFFFYETLTVDLSIFWWKRFQINLAHLSISVFKIRIQPVEPGFVGPHFRFISPTMLKLRISSVISLDLIFHWPPNKVKVIHLATSSFS